jgi:hypothetical protein
MIGLPIEAGLLPVQRSGNTTRRGTMGVRRGIAIAAGVTIASFGIPLATAAAAFASSSSSVCGEITGPHTFTLCQGETVTVGELLQPETPGYNTYVQVVAVSTNSAGVTTVTTDDTFLPLNRSNESTGFTVVSLPSTPPTTPPGTPPPPPPYHPRW